MYIRPTCSCKTYPAQTFGRARTTRGRAPGRDLLTLEPFGPMAPKMALPRGVGLFLMSEVPLYPVTFPAY